jgi:hypothetical protein
MIAVANTERTDHLRRLSLTEARWIVGVRGFAICAGDQRLAVVLGK